MAALPKSWKAGYHQAALKARLIVGIALVLMVITIGLAVMHRERRVPPRILVLRPELPADGNFHRLGTVTLRGNKPVRTGEITVSGLNAILTQATSSKLDLLVRSPVQPGEQLVGVRYRDVATTVRVHFVASAMDSIGNGTPDFLRLHTAEDRTAFRAWFTSMAEAAADMPAGKLPAEISTSAALLRWCYRNALRGHEVSWQSFAWKKPLDVCSCVVSGRRID